MRDNLIRIRFVERPLNEREIAPQAEAIRDAGSLRELSISSVGFEMLTALVGKGMTPSLQRVVGDSPQDTLHGRKPMDDHTAGDMFTEVYGETIGPLVTCLERGGDFDIIRLEREKGADLLLVKRDSLKVILQECKGTLADYAKVVNNGSDLDVCQQIRRQRNEGRDQLSWPEASEIGGRRVRVQGPNRQSAQAFPHAEKTVVVTAITDGRLRRCSTRINPPSHAPCTTDCTTQCIFTPDPTLICVLSSEAVDDSCTLNSGTRNFLDWYKACERAIWGRSHGSVGQVFSKLVPAWQNMEMSSSQRELTISALTGLLDRAIQRGVYVDYGPIFQSVEGIQNPELSRSIRYMHELQGEIPRPRINVLSDPRELGAMLYQPEGDIDVSESVIGNWQLELRGPGEMIAAEAAIERKMSGGLAMRLVPSEATPSSESENALPASGNLQLGISSILAGGRFHEEYISEMFETESASWRIPAEAERNSNRMEGRRRKNAYRLGKVLWMPPLWGPWGFPFVDKSTLKEMHNCCPYCDKLAMMIEHDWPFPFHPKYWRHHRHHISSKRPFAWGHPLAFVTSDARGFANLWNLSMRSR